MSWLQGALYVFYIGYGIYDLPSPAYIPVTLRSQNGSGITVQCDAYRPKETRAQSVLFSSDRLDTKQTYTITVTKTNDTDSNSINIDAFVLTQAEGEAASIGPLGTTFSVFLLRQRLTPFVAPPVSSFGFGTSTTSITPAQTDSATNAESRNTSPNTAAIAGGVLGGITFGIFVTFLVFRWWTKREREKRGLIAPDVPSTSQYSDDSRRHDYFTAAPPYQAKLTGVPPRARMPGRTHRHRRYHSASSSFGHPAPLSTTPARSSVSEMTRVHRGEGKAQYLGHSTLASSIISASSPIVPPSPEDEFHLGADLPAYSRV